LAVLKTTSLPNSFVRDLQRVAPGLALCAAVTTTAYVTQATEEAMVGKAWVEALAIAILLGAALRSVWVPGTRLQEGIEFSAKHLLEIAVVLLGASVSAAAIASAGPALLAGVVGIVAMAIMLSAGIGLALGLPIRMALLIACGNAICGNSAIAAVAPVIDADGDDVAASIAFTAVFGVVVVLALPVVGPALGLGGFAYGALAGLTVYAVPQVIAAASPLGAVAMQTGTLVKLLRVLMLGPVCLGLSLIARRLPAPTECAAVSRDAPTRPDYGHLVPWFIVGFIVMVACRSLGLLPPSIIEPIGHLATLLTVVSMAALGLGVDVRSIAQAGARVVATVMLSLLTLGGMSLLLIRHLPLS
jgi:uncharacterized integral membrane protein (TIGR00698 family)